MLETLTLELSSSELKASSRSRHGDMNVTDIGGGGDISGG